MSRTIYVSGGRTDTLRVQVVDAYDNDMSTATLRIGLSTDRNTVPATWLVPTSITYPNTTTAVVSILLNSSNAPPNTYWAWLDVVDSPSTQPVRASNDTVVTL